MSSDLDDDTRWKIEVFREKLRHSLSARFFPRFHVSLILLFAIAMGWVTDLLLLAAGLDKMAARYVLAIVGAYLTFLFGVYLWIEYSGIREYINVRKRNELIGEDVPRDREKISRGDAVDAALSADFLMVGPEGCLIVLAVLATGFGVFYFLGGYIFAYATTFFAEIVLELLLAAGLLHGLKRVESSGWLLSVWRSTWPSLLFSILVALLVAGYVQSKAPKAKTLPEAWKMQAKYKKA